MLFSLLSLFGLKGLPGEKGKRGEARDRRFDDRGVEFGGTCSRPPFSGVVIFDKDMFERLVGFELLFQSQ
eukprot:m.16598 g.16598  ORF g.16598 m.16598 type:complete len:70 (+) comp4645_c1_seq1:2178-2387(+)